MNGEFKSKKLYSIALLALVWLFYTSTAYGTNYKNNIQLNQQQMRLLAAAGFENVSKTEALETQDVNSVVLAEKEVLSTLEQRLQKPITVDFRNTPIDDVLMIMADQADIDVIKSPRVIGEVTASLTDVPLGEALTNILAAQGYDYVMTKNMIRVAPADEIEIKAERLVNRIYRITYADVTEVEKALKKFISARGSLSSNPGTSNVIVTDTESKIKAIDTFIEEIDRITPQILVEARIYDITTKDRLDLGIEWAVGTNTTIGSTIGSNPTAGNKDPFITSGFSGATSKAETADGTLRFGWFNSNIDIDAIIKAQQERICATLLANPRVLVLDNEPAVIKIVSEIPFQELTETSAGGSIGTTQFREVGVELKVIPHFTRDGMIRLNVAPEFSIDTGNVQIGGQGFAEPVIDRRKSETTLLVKDGQTVVLGGLRKKDVSQQESKIPLLGDLPLVGFLFKFNGEETVVSELVVFITTHIVEEPVLSNDEQITYGKTEICTPGCKDTRLEACTME